MAVPPGDSSEKATFQLVIAEWKLLQIQNFKPTLVGWKWDKSFHIESYASGDDGIEIFGDRLIYLI